MTVWVGSIAVWLALAVFVALATAWHGAQFWADHLKSIELRPRRLPAFWQAGWTWDITPIANFYSDLHHEYGSRFITGCVWTVRVSLPALGLFTLIALGASLVR